MRRKTLPRLLVAGGTLRRMIHAWLVLWIVMQAAPAASAPALSPHEQSLLRARELAPQVQITRDEFGVAHVHAATDFGAVFGGMYARAEDEMARIETRYAQMTGRASLYHGERGLTWDRMVLSFEVPELAKAECEAAPADVRAIAQAGADA